MTSGPLPGLIILSGTRAGEIFYLGSHMVTIGSEAGNDIRLADHGVLAQHAIIRQDPSRRGTTFQIYNVGTSSDVKVNDITVHLRHPLSDGDRITIGPVVFELFVPPGGRQDRPS